MRNFSVSIRSGSSGNSTYVRTESARLAVDCAMSGRQFQRALESFGESARELDALLLTHEHTDHASGIGVLMRRFKLPLYVTEKTFYAVEESLGKIADSQVHFITPGEHFAVLDTQILAFSTPHDAVDSVGFRVATKEGDIGIATDLGHFSETVREGLKGCRIVHIESNFDPDMLETGPYPRSLKRRIASAVGHLSNDEAALAASWLIRHGTLALALSHLSEENNEPGIARHTVSTFLATEGVIEESDYMLSVSKRIICSDPISCSNPFETKESVTGFLGEQLSLFSPDYACQESGR